MYLKEFIEKERAKPLGADEVLKMSYRAALREMDYEKLEGKSLKTLLPKTPSGILIMFTDHANPKRPIGHFCILMRGKHGIEFFDPLGLGLRNVTSVTHSRKHLQKLLEGHDFVNNKVKYQKLENDTNTCGRHCVTRWNCIGMTPKKYQMLMHSKQLSPDEIVVMMTMDQDLTKL